MDDTLTLVSWRARPRRFVALMGLYESNYIRLGWLAGDLVALDGRHRSVVAQDCDLLLTMTERSPYTSTVNLTYLFSGEGLPGADGEMQFPDDLDAPARTITSTRTHASRCAAVSGRSR